MESEPNPLNLDFDDFPTVKDINDLIVSRPKFHKQYETLEYLTDESGNYDVSKILLTPVEIKKITNMKQLVEHQNPNSAPEEVNQILRDEIKTRTFATTAAALNKHNRHWYKKVLGIGKSSTVNVFEEIAANLDRIYGPWYKRAFGIGKFTTEQVMWHTAQADNMLYNRIKEYNTPINS